MRRRKKKNTFFEFLSNVIMLFLFVVITAWGIQITNAATTTLKFAQISDAHYSSHGINNGYRMSKESPDLLDDAIRQVNATQNIDFVMFTGDLINVPFERELTSALKHINLNAPWYFVFGNHDTCVGGFLTKKVYMKILSAKNKNLRNKSSYYTFSPKAGYKVIALDTIITSRLTANGRIDDEQVAWLKKELAKSNNETIIIFTHVPIIEPFSSPSHKLLNDKEIYDLLKAQDKPILVFSGHYHTTKVIKDGKMLFVNTPSLVSYPNAFRIATIKNQKNKVVAELQFKETELKEVQTKAKLMSFNSKTYYGDGKDRTQTFELER